MNHTTASGGAFGTEDLTFYLQVSKCMRHNYTLGKSDAVATAHDNMFCVYKTSCSPNKEHERIKWELPDLQFWGKA